MLLFPLIIRSYQNKKTLRVSKSDIAALQKNKFRALISYCAQHSPYYRRIIAQNHIDIENCTPQDFPILTKKNLIEHFDEIVTQKDINKKKIAQFLHTSSDPHDLFLNKYIVIHTSGSSGTVGYYIYSQNEFIQGISTVTRANGLQTFQKLAYIAATRGHFAGITMASAARQLPFLYTDVQCFDINQPFSLIIDGLNLMQPTCVSGYAFALRKIAEAQQEGTLHIRPRILQSGGEPLSKNDASYIQSVFQAPIINLYASSEHLLMGIGRDQFDGMYLMEDNLMFEIYPNETRVTNLYNYTLPLIRYQMSDLLRPMTDTTHIMPFTKIEEIIGRNEQVPLFLNDAGDVDFISPILLVEFHAEHLARFQIVLQSRTSFIFRACLRENLTQKQIEKTERDIMRKLQTILQEKNMNRVQYSVEIVQNLWADPKTGKFKLIIEQ